MNKIRQSTRRKNASTNLKLFSYSVRGLKSKVDSLLESISEYQPVLIYLVETNLQKWE